MRLKFLIAKFQEGCTVTVLYQFGAWCEMRPPCRRGLVSRCGELLNLSPLGEANGSKIRRQYSRDGLRSDIDLTDAD